MAEIWTFLALPDQSAAEPAILPDTEAGHLSPVSLPGSGQSLRMSQDIVTAPHSTSM